MSYVELMWSRYKKSLIKPEKYVMTEELSLEVDFGIAEFVDSGISEQAMKDKLPGMKWPEFLKRLENGRRLTQEGYKNENFSR